MRTDFPLAQLADPEIDAANTILRTCVHCGFCTATCPTYVLLGDELDSPRGRIYMIKNLLESGQPATAASMSSAPLLAGMGKASGLVNAEYQETSPRKEMSRSLCRILISLAISRAQRTSLLWVWP